MIRYLLALAIAGTCSAQTATWPNVATDQDLLVAKDGAQSALTSGINSSTLSIPVSNGALFAQYSIVRIDNEYIQICSISSNTLTACSRGLVGSAASHLAGAAVRDVVSAYHYNRLRVEVKGMQARLLPARAGTSLPSTCAASRELFVDTDASPNPTLHLCNSAGNGWAQIAGGSSGSGAEIPYEADITGTSISITAATHGKGLYPDMRVYANNAYVPLQYAVNGSGDISATGLLNGIYHVRIWSGEGTTGTPYEADFTGVDSIGPITQTTHGKGQYPTVLLFADGAAVPVRPSIDGSGAVTILGLLSGNYHIKVY
jgi:hypothetical protein